MIKCLSQLDKLHIDCNPGSLSYKTDGTPKILERAIFREDKKGEERGGKVERERGLNELSGLI